MITYTNCFMDLILIRFLDNNYHIDGFKVHDVSAYDNRYKIHIDNPHYVFTLNSSYINDKDLFDTYSVLRIKEDDKLNIHFLEILHVYEGKLLCVNANISSSQMTKVLKILYPNFD